MVSAPLKFINDFNLLTVFNKESSLILLDPLKTKIMVINDLNRIFTLYLY